MSEAEIAKLSPFDEALLALHSCADLKGLFREGAVRAKDLFGSTEARLVLSRGAGLPSLVLRMAGNGVTESRLDPRWQQGTMAESLRKADPLVVLGAEIGSSDRTRLPQALFADTAFDAAVGISFCKNPKHLHALILVGSEQLRTAVAGREFDVFARHFRMALERRLRADDDHAADMMMRSFVGGSCTGLITLNWELLPRYSNRAAIRYCKAWIGKLVDEENAGRKDRVSLPIEIFQECARIKNELLLSKNSSFAVQPAVVLASANSPGLRAGIRLVSPTHSGRQRPFFQIRLEWPMGGVEHGPNRRQENADDFRSLLSPSEQRLLDVAALGLPNEEIAVRLGKSLATVKSQIQSIYRKLSVSNRSELMALISGYSSTSNAA